MGKGRRRGRGKDGEDGGGSTGLTLHKITPNSFPAHSGRWCLLQGLPVTLLHTHPRSIEIFEFAFALQDCCPVTSGAENKGFL